MLYNTEAIVIRSIPYGENHAVLSLLTPTGIVAAMARGAKKPQSRLAASVHMCVQGIYTIYQNRGMGTIQQFELVNSRRRVREQLDTAAYAAYFCELVGAAAEERPNGSEYLYRQFVALMDKLSQADQRLVDLCRVWELKILQAVGAAPVWGTCVRCGADAGSSDTYALAEGGFLCLGCVASNRQQGRMLKVPRGLAGLLTKIQRVPLERIGNIQLSDTTSAALKVILHAQLTEFAGLSLRSRTVLDSLDIL